MKHVPKQMHKGKRRLAILKQHLEHLSVTIGERHLGSKGEERAKEYIAASFKALGYETLLEPFAVPGWRYGKYRIRIGGEPIPCFPCYFSPGGEVSAPLRTLFPQEPGFEMPDLSGVVAFVGNFQFLNVHETNALATRIEAAGALALIINSPYNDTVSTKIIRNPKLCSMPVFTVSLRTALRLAAAEGETIQLSLEAEKFEHTSHNVVARYIPKGKPRGKIVVGGHYDTAPGIPGAADNASGTALTLYLAEVLKDSLGPYAVDFVAFGGEEFVHDETVDPGIPGYGTGGYAYVRDHAFELDQIIAMLNLDDIGTYLSHPEARVGRSARLKDIIREESVEARIRPIPYGGGSDNGIFNKHGIPTVWFFDGGADTGIRHFPLHSPQDDINLIHWEHFSRIAGDLERIVQRVANEGLAAYPSGVISPLEPADIDAAAELVRTLWTMGIASLREKHYHRIIGTPWQDQIECSVREYLSQDGVEAFKMTVDGRFAGFLGFRADGKTRIGEVGYNAVHPDFVGRGLGRELLDAALAELASHGMEQAEVVTGMDPGHAPARAMYLGAGFKPMQTLTRYTLPLK